jgi:hypothetical protein
LGADELASLLETDLGEPEMPILPMVEPMAPTHAAFALPEPEATFLPPPASEPPSEELDLPAAPMTPVAPLIPVAAPAATSIPASSDALVQALMADPQAMAQLSKALVAQLGEEQLKALAWEVLPDLAKKLSS